LHGAPVQCGHAAVRLHSRTAGASAGRPSVSVDVRPEQARDPAAYREASLTPVCEQCPRWQHSYLEADHPQAPDVRFLVGIPTRVPGAGVWWTVAPVGNVPVPFGDPGLFSRNDRFPTIR
jgi:hypothetical protein